MNRNTKIRCIKVPFKVMEVCVRLNLITLGDLADYPIEKLYRSKRVSRKTILDINELIKIVEE